MSHSRETSISLWNLTDDSAPMDWKTPVKCDNDNIILYLNLVVWDFARPKRWGIYRSMNRGPGTLGCGCNSTRPVKITELFVIPAPILTSITPRTTPPDPFYWRYLTCISKRRKVRFVVFRLMTVWVVHNFAYARQYCCRRVQNIQWRSDWFKGISISRKYDFHSIINFNQICIYYVGKLVKMAG